jgi:hypothetical protein
LRNLFEGGVLRMLGRGVFLRGGGADYSGERDIADLWLASMT